MRKKTIPFRLGLTVETRAVFTRVRGLRYCRYISHYLATQEKAVKIEELQAAMIRAGYPQPRSLNSMIHALQQMRENGNVLIRREVPSTIAKAKKNEKKEYICSREGETNKE